MLLLAACLLAAAAAATAAKPGNSTLDTKKGYKTKTGSTSSVTLALALALTLGWGHSECWGPKWSNDVAKAAMILFNPINMAGMAKLANCKG